MILRIFSDALNQRIGQDESADCKCKEPHIGKASDRIGVVFQAEKVRALQTPFIDADIQREADWKYAEEKNEECCRENHDVASERFP